jgi:hypothetical protein
MTLTLHLFTDGRRAHASAYARPLTRGVKPRVHLVKSRDAGLPAVAKATARPPKRLRAGGKLPRRTIVKSVSGN